MKSNPETMQFLMEDSDATSQDSFNCDWSLHHIVIVLSIKEWLSMKCSDALATLFWTAVKWNSILINSTIVSCPASFNPIVIFNIFFDNVCLGLVDWLNYWNYWMDFQKNWMGHWPRKNTSNLVMDLDKGVQER